MDYTYNAENFRKYFERQFTWHAGFMRNVRRFAGKTALIDPAAEKSWTYAELNEDCCRLASALKAHGVGKNDVVLYQLMNSPQFAFCYIAPQKLGAINSPANFNLAPGETAYVIDANKPKAYFYDCEQLEKVKEALSICVHKPDIIVAVDYFGQKPELPEGHVFYDDFVQGVSCGEPEREDEENIYAEVTRLFTSGTTGMPKGVPLNNANEVMSAHDVIMHFPLSNNDITMNMTPWFHRGGLHSGGLTPTLYAGATSVILRNFNAKTCLETAVKHKVTFLIGVPAVLNKLAMRQERHPVDLKALKGIVTMGSPLEKQDCIRYQELLTPNIFNGYGTTETFWNSFLRPADLPEMSGTAGRSCTDDEVRIVKMYDDKHAEPDELVPMDKETQGEIIISAVGKSTLSYFNNEEATNLKYYKGWLYTGDAGTWDENQYITICGRKDDMILCGGENIYPVQIEEALNQHPKVSECIVTGVPDPARGEALVAYVVPNGEVTVRELISFCASHRDLPDYKCPRYYCLVDSIPYTATGKKRHVEMKKRALDDLNNGRLVKF